MSTAPVIAALGLPADARIDRRIPRKTLLEQGVPTPADRRLLQTAIEAMHWVAALKPATTGLPAFQDDQREYLEIAIIACALRDDRRLARVLELLHRAIPYPVVLVVDTPGGIRVSLAHKRTSLAQDGKVVIEDVRTTAAFNAAQPTESQREFLRHLALDGLAPPDLFAVYDAWVGCIDALAAAGVTGTFRFARTSGQIAEVRGALDDLDVVAGELAELRNRALREPQIARRVELNLAIQQLLARQEQLKHVLKGGSQ